MNRHALSPAQEAIWFEEQLRRGAGNTGFFAATFVGDLAEEHVAAACQAVVRRHAPLRTVVRVVGDRPILEVLPTTQWLSYQTVDLPCPPGEEMAATHSWRDRSGKRCFDLTSEPPIVFVLLRHGHRRCTLLVVAHHLCFDGRSKFVFARELAAALTALRAGAAPPAQPVPWPAWPAVGDQVNERATEYWNAVDVESFAAVKLPRGEAATARVGTTGQWFVDGRTRRRLVEIAAAHGTNLFGALLATTAVTLYGYGNTRMVLCAPVDVTTPQTRDLIGLGVNIVPFVVTLDGDDSFVSVLAMAHAARRRIKEFGLVPLRVLSTGKPWSAGSRALFSRMSVSYMRMATDVPGVAGLDITWDFIAHNSAETFDLMFHMRDAYDRLAFRLDFSGTDLDARSATAIAGHFRSALSRVLAAPTAPLRTLALFAARGTVTSGAAVTVHPDHSLVALCAGRAAQYADRPAIVGPTGSISYRGLAAACRGPRAAPAVIDIVATLGQPTQHQDRCGQVAAPQGPAVAALCWQARHLGLARGHRMLALAPPGSAQFWQECWLTWVSGGTLYLPRDRDAAAVHAALLEYGITTMVAPYHILRRLTGDATALPLRDAITPMAQLRPSTDLLGLVRAGVRVHAQYVHHRAGPVAMETCVPARLAHGYSPVLRDLAEGVRLSVRAPDGRILPAGVTGRLVVETPMSPPETGWASHASGDLAEVDRRGVVHYHGAAEDTVEWAGQALNMPSLERHLAMHPDVDEAVVVARGHRPAAYLVPRAGTQFDVREARRHLRRRSVPRELRLSEVRVVGALPRRPDGNVDRGALADGACDARA